MIIHKSLFASITHVEYHLLPSSNACYVRDNCSNAVCMSEPFLLLFSANPSRGTSERLHLEVFL